MTVPDWAAAVVAELRYPVVFATVSGAHLYGFASVDSDLDLRGAHLLPLPELVGLRHGPNHLRVDGIRDGVELDVVTHELGRFCAMLLRPDGYVLEQLLSPLVVATSPVHAELVALAPRCVTRHHAHHYLGFARSQWLLHQRTGELKPALYTLRVLLTGINLMRTGELVADLRRLPGAPPYVPELIGLKAAGEHRELPADLDLGGRLAADVAALTADLEQARDASTLPEKPSAADALHDLVVRTRLA